MTWGGKSAAGPVLPVEEAARKAAEAKKGSAHPQTPDEGITHPAGYPDPTQPSAYENGDTSSWAEDPKGPPYRTSPAPAVPVDDGGYKHPATQPGAPAKNAADKEATRDLRARVEHKATLCLHIASAMLGAKIATSAEGGDKVASDMLELQALDLMDLSDERIASTLRRIEAATEDEEVLLRKMLAEDKGEEEGEKSEEEKKEAAKKVAEDVVSTKLAEVTSMLANLQAQMATLKGGQAPKVSEEEAMLAEMMKEESAPKVSEEEGMLAEMLKEEAAKAAAPAYAQDDTEAMLKAMLAEEVKAPEAPAKAEAPAPEAPAQAAGKSLAQYLEEDVGVSMDVVDDPMGMLDAPVLSQEDDAVLASLFASELPDGRTAGKKGEESEEEVEDEGDDAAKKDEEIEDEAAEEDSGKEAAVRQAAEAAVVGKLKPQPKKASTGAKTVGTQVRTAGTGSDITELAKLWGSAPDVSGVFK
jgi:hypothetical protein